MLRFVPGMYIDKVLWLREGETKVVPETDGQYYVANEKFILENYDKNKDKTFETAIDRAGMVVKNYQTNAVLYKRVGPAIPGEQPELEKVKEHKIRVNQPLKFEKFALYQVDYKLDELNTMYFSLTNKANGKTFGDIKINLYDPKPKYDLGNGYHVEVLSFFPDFEFAENGEPTTKSRIPNNPAFVFKMTSPEVPKGETSFVAIQQTIEPLGDNQYKMAFKGIETKNVTALTVRKDLTLWIIILGGIIFMIGVIQGAYWNHRRIWVQNKNGEVWIAAHTNKNWFGLKREIETALSETKIIIPNDQIQGERMDKEGV
jgi:cytochrome c biogenesis protein